MQLLRIIQHPDSMPHPRPNTSTRGPTRNFLIDRIASEAVKRAAPAMTRQFPIVSAATTIEAMTARVCENWRPQGPSPRVRHQHGSHRGGLGGHAGAARRREGARGRGKGAEAAERGRMALPAVGPGMAAAGMGG